MESLESFLSNSGVENVLQARAQKSTTTQNPPSTTEEVEETLATQVTVGSQPDICKTPNFLWKKTMSVPGGIVFRVTADKFGWGPAGSVWNITTSGGAKLVHMNAKCQGRICSVKGSNLEDGTIKQRADGSWFMQTTPHMQPTLMISGELVAENRASEQNYTLEVSSQLACWLPVAKNCSGINFVSNQTQWEAYTVDRYLGDITKQKHINSYYDLGAKLADIALPPQVAKYQSCHIDKSLKDCRRPSPKDCERQPDPKHFCARMSLEA
ncbi:hypothetical protein N7512_006220 [Penicillium capsulatum]|nr:hypothetical protein N7512_006220 [Penicillium capsulatum]